MNVNPLRQLKAIQLAFSFNDSIELFEEIASRKPLIGFFFKLHAATANFLPGRLLLLGYGVLAFGRVRLPAQVSDSLLATWAYNNEKKEIEQIASYCPDLKLQYLDLRPTNLFTLRTIRLLVVCFAKAKLRRRIFSLLKRSSGKLHFLPLCQSVALVGYYLRLNYELGKH